MSTFRDVELVRIPVEDTPTQEEVSHRPAASVFPSESRKMKKVDEAVAAHALAGKTTRFVSEAQLQQNKELHGESFEDGTLASRSLTEAIVAQREAKQQKFDEAWKTIKQGRNRPLEPDELAFLDSLHTEELARERAKREAEEAALSQFRAAQAGASTSGQDGATDVLLEPRTAAALRPVLPIKKKAAKHAVRVAVKATVRKTSEAPPVAASDARKLKPAPPEKPAGLSGLLGAYDSEDSGEESS